MGQPEESHVPLHKLDKRTKAQILRDVGHELTRAGVASRGSMEWILHARVPIIKFASRRAGGLEVDLCLGSEGASFKAWSVSQVASIHPAFGKLFRIVKLWAKAHSINDGAAHMFNSWCLTLVVIFFLQQGVSPPLLPPLYELLYDKRPDEATPRVMQDGEQELSAEVFKIMATRAEHARALYGSRPCPPLELLFRDFLRSCGGLLKGLLGSRPGAEPREFVTFEVFKKRHMIAVHNEAKYETPEERAVREAAEEARKQAKRAKDKMKKAAKAAQQAAQAQARNASAAARAEQAAGGSGSQAATAVAEAGQAAAAAAAAAAMARPSAPPPPPPAGRQVPPRVALAAEAKASLRAHLAGAGTAAAPSRRRTEDDWSRRTEEWYNSRECTTSPGHRYAVNQFWEGGGGAANSSAGPRVGIGPTVNPANFDGATNGRRLRQAASAAGDASPLRVFAAASAAACRDACGSELKCWTYLYDGSTPYGHDKASSSGGTCSLMATPFAGTAANLSTLSWTSGNCHGGELRTLLLGGVSPAKVGSPAITEAAAFALATFVNSSASCPGQCEALRREAAAAGGGAPRLVRLLAASEQVVSGVSYGFTLLAELTAAGNEPPRKVVVAAEVWSRPWLNDTTDTQGPATQLLDLSYALVGSDEELARLPQ
ncbi:hypothetical protein GPECTOR_61g803 [Gonium pectorale]|uniref:PAP-associated domain-containing protein n=1 Tax=Gonium pectorale TaxID=33097 RepID=A0A150G692_GONPE|nr:hypothetical protein GPECTOR_61g803 [Gonium pectorale]|eukprot:KXZ44850.1 hypothetical protein GPECTOR_61g803 [Gonium pectorale]